MSIASEEYREIKGFRNYYEISNFGNIRSSIDNCLNNRAKTAGGYIWKYVKEGDYIVN